MAIESELLALAFRTLNELGFKVWFQKGCGLNWCFPCVFGIDAKFPRRKFDSISPFFRDRNPATLYLKCIIAHKMLSSPSFFCENKAMRMPHFHGENPTEFCVWCALAHRQGFMPMYTMRANMLMLVIVIIIKNSSSFFGFFYSNLHYFFLEGITCYFVSQYPIKINFSFKIYQ